MLTIIIGALLALPSWQQLSPAQERALNASVIQARDAFDRTLNDYPSARFREVVGWVSADGTTNPQICGLVNAKNLAGAYVGWRRFAVLGGDTLTIEGSALDNATVDVVCTDSPDLIRSPTDYSAALASR